MKKLITILIVLLLGATAVNAQKYFTRAGYVRFFSHSSFEDIEAKNNRASCIIDTKTGEIVSKVLIKSFRFYKALMQEHFNENYMESDKFPKAILKAKISNVNKIDFTKTEKQNISFTGTLSMHGVTKNVVIKGTIMNKNGKIIAEAKFNAKPKDYNIKIPATVVNNIAEIIEVTVKFELNELKK